MKIKIIFLLLNTVCVVYGIFGGVKLIEEDAEFPWFVALHHLKADQFFCSGSLISEKHVLTGATCLQQPGDETKLKAEEVLCMLGRFNISEPNEAGSLNASVSTIVIHPDWDSNSFDFDSDIAIAVLANAVQFTKRIKSVSLPKMNFDEVVGVGIIVGWGKSEHSGYSFTDSTPSSLAIPAINSSYCYATVPKLAQHTSVSLFCGGYENQKKGPCLGDSGGGFYVKDPTTNLWNVRGIVSGSLADIEHGCDVNKFSLYTNVARFIEWIEKVIIETKKYD